MSDILKANVDEKGLTELIIRLGRDCTPDQFVREFTKNSIEACQRTGKPGTILVDFDQVFFEQSEVNKICFIDNGDGMTKDQMLTHLRSLSSSGENNNQFANYGMGSKVAAFTRNHAGIQYQSWRDGIGHQVFIEYDEQEKCYAIPPISEGNWAPKLQGGGQARNHSGARHKGYAFWHAT